ncbi:DmsC/YnfH family molybdoenzyme membrane anchor subunit [Azohydromonas lata]|uniref:DmsC/YnfH family molybdoenzyme membrane anchor subunit n=1 Tax=Azohydromonas lata TaxID=45677 RepID=UPI00082DB88F|nr:DmsC/YnfH family molybdoenzyme membrane anchor subunit [Azohydromonas lata]
MFERREFEPGYAVLPDAPCKSHNQWGKGIETVPVGDERRGQSLNINGDGMVGDNPNRYKQHGFFFNADNCIACHACETACSEKNDNPAHQAFRSVGFIEGGTFPNVSRINISLACNHCDDPVCLKGCPTRAYTKFAEYGAVLQNPDICFGCGYCTWVCPYNAPQLDQAKGTVSKCNMCVDRLEVGLKPACVSACVGKALDFGVVENIPEGRVQAKLEIPGFPSPEITHPNTRFQQTKTLARDMHRVDSVPIKFHRKDDDGNYVPVLDPKQGFEKHWNLKKLLGSHENSHIAFTLTAQLAAGAFALLTAGAAIFQPLVALQDSVAWLAMLLAMMGLLIFGMFKLNMHLGRPHRFYRGYYNLKYSPVAREIAGVTVFTAGLGAYLALAVAERAVPGLAQPLVGALQGVFAAVGGLGIAFGGFYMIKLYRIKARPFWNHWHTDASFIASALSLGALLVGVVAVVLGVASEGLVRIVAGVAAIGLALEGAAVLAHARDLREQQSEGAASFYIQTTQYGRSYALRNGLLGAALVLALAALAAPRLAVVLLPLLAVVALAQSVLGRALFFAAVIPTTLPGGFFWRNPGFVEHARKVGLADMPQVGVVHEQHHAFKVGELLDTVMKTPLRDKVAQAKRVFTG